jgi:hypothetical protein
MSKICQLGSCLERVDFYGVAFNDDSVYPGFVEILDVCIACLPDQFPYTTENETMRYLDWLKYTPTPIHG